MALLPLTQAGRGCSPCTIRALSGQRRQNCEEEEEPGPRTADPDPDPDPDPP